ARYYFMHARILLRKSKNQSLEEDQTKDGDRIGNLPDEILQCILCFLSTKDVVRTRIVSRRW
ncbi:unnamed protein product, partial [Ilex paraguariensis]